MRGKWINLLVLVDHSRGVVIRGQLRTRLHSSAGHERHHAGYLGLDRLPNVLDQLDRLANTDRQFLRRGADFCGPDRQHQRGRNLISGAVVPGYMTAEVVCFKVPAQVVEIQP